MRLQSPRTRTINPATARQPMPSLSDIFARLDGRIENRSFDLKREPPTVDDLVKEIQGGMNGVEPEYLVLIGVDEGPAKRFDRANVTPVTWPAGKGGAFKDADAYRLAVSGALRATTEGYKEGCWHFEAFDHGGGQILAVTAFQSPDRPHQNSKDHRYHIRRAGETTPMTAAEIREAMAATAPGSTIPPGGGGGSPGHTGTGGAPSAEEHAAQGPRPPVPEGELLADLRDHHWVPNADELRFAGGPQVHLRLLPASEGAFTPFDIKGAIGNGLCPLGRWRAGSDERVADGYLWWRVEGESGQMTGSFTKVFETGEIWGVDTDLVGPHGDAAANIPAVIVERLHGMLTSYGRAMQDLLHLPGPYTVQIVLHGVAGAPIHTTARGHNGRHLKERFLFEASWDRSTEPKPDAICNAFAAALWKACGLPPVEFKFR